MSKIILALFLLSSSLFAQFNTEQKTETISANIWDTVTITSRQADNKSLKIKGTGSFIVSFPQWPDYSRDTTRSYEVYESTEIARWNNLPFDVQKIYVTSTSTCTLTVFTYYMGMESKELAKASSSINLFGYTYKDSVNTWSMHQIYDSITVTRLATIDSAAITNIYMSNGTTSRLWFGTSDNIYGSNGDLWLNTTTRINSTGILVGDGVTGQPFVTKSGSVSNTHYGFYSDVNTGMYRIGADNLGLAVGGTKAVDISATNIGLMLPTAFAQMDETARDALTPGAGWVIWNTTSSRLQVFNGITWDDLH